MRSGLNTAVRVEFMARHVPSQAGNETSEDVETLFVSFPCINSLLSTVGLRFTWVLAGNLAHALGTRRHIV